MTIYTPTSGGELDMGLPRMELIYFGNEFPKDDLEDLFRRIHNHSKDNNHFILTQFINEATLAIKDEIRRLPTELKQSIPPFDTILRWAEPNELRNGLMCGAVDGVLLVVAQLAAYIGYIENSSREFNDSTNLCLAGLGIGLLASTAISLSKTLVDIPLAGADVVRLAFRLGIHVMGVSENLEARDLSERPSTWAYVVHNADSEDVQNELEFMHSRSETPDTGKVFISAVSRTSVTVSGPPTRLNSIFNKSQFFREKRFIALPVYGGLCHAPHVYGVADTHSIVHGTHLNTVRANFSPTIPVYSTSTGLPYPFKTAADLFESVVMELLTKAIYWDRVIHDLVDRMKENATAEAVLFSFGNSIPLNDLQTAIKNDVPSVKLSTKSLISWLFHLNHNGFTPRTPAQAKLAIIGMSCRLPGGVTNTEKFWGLLENGLDVSRRIPADRFDVETHFDPTGKDLNKTMTQYGCFIEEPGLFDAPFFNMSPREAQVVDPQMRLSLVTAYEALERAGYVGNRTASTRLERIGTYYGQAADDYREVNQGQEVSTYYIPGGCRAFGPGRINYFFKFAGPSYSIDTACSSGLAAIEVACQAIWSGAVDMAVAGGVNVLTNPDGFTGLCKGHFLTQGHNACKTWDATADGYCRADGVGSVVIKKLEDAEADNDNILGVILGAGTNHSAEAVSITHPHAGHQAYLSRQVLGQCGVNPLDVSYIELHGTGTQAGDHEEMQGIMEVYAPLTKRRNKDQPLHIGSVKANIGHGESVAGVSSLIKALLMLQKNAIPPHVGIKTSINPKFKDLDKRNLRIPFQKTPWLTVPGKRRLLAVNNFGAAGGNTTMVLEEAPDRVILEKDHRPKHVITVSAKTKGSLTGNIERLVAYLDGHPDTNIADLAYTTNARRYHHSHRVAIATSDIAHLTQQLKSRLEKVDLVKPVKSSEPPPVAFVFTGQGASYKSMSLELYRDIPTFQQHIQHLDSLARGQGFPSFIPALDGSFPKDHAHSPVVTHLTLACTEIAMAKYWISLEVKPDVVLGHSLGEYAAMHIAGVVTASDTIFMVGRRAQMLEERCKIGSHAMMAVRASLSQIDEVCAGKSYKYTIACVNSPFDTVLSGTNYQIDDLASVLGSVGYRCIKLDVAFAFHSEQTDPILDDFEAISKAGVVFSEPKLPVISPLLGKVVFDGKTFSANYVRRATRETVDFSSALESARMISTISDDTIWIEIGPHPVCVGFVKSTIPSTQLTVASMRRGEDNWKTMAEAMASLHVAAVEVDWNEFHRPFESKLRLLDLPTYAWNEKNYWLQYNGDWCLTKGNTFYTKEQSTKAKSTIKSLPRSEIQTTSVQRIIEQTFEGPTGTVVMQSDLMQTDLLAAAHGHRMNNCGVVTSSIHADIAYTLGDHLYRKLVSKTEQANMNIANLVVTTGLVAHSNNGVSQLIRVTAVTTNVHAGKVDLTWQNVDNNGNVHEPFATAELHYERASEWMSVWSPVNHLVQGRIEALERLAVEGKANRFSRSMAYTLFANNLVDYEDKYRGMQSVVMYELEAFADVQLTTKERGVWVIPPYFIDSLAHLGGFVMNCSDAMDTKNNFCVTPGWKSMRFSKPLLPGAKYRSYVKMIPTIEDPTIFLGDVYILQDNSIVGMVGGLQFRRYPRLLLNRFFSPPDRIPAAGTKPTPPAPKASVSTPAHPTPKSEPRSKSVSAVPTPDASNAAQSQRDAPSQEAATTGNTGPEPASSADTASASDSISAKALTLIAREAALDISDLEDDASFSHLGIDSLMSLVIAEKFMGELGVKVGGSLFLDYPTIGDLRKWLDEYYA